MRVDRRTNSSVLINIQLAVRIYWIKYGEIVATYVGRVNFPAN